MRRQAHNAESPAQFIATTFKPELAEAGDSWTAVSLANHASFVQRQTRAQAVAFLHKLEREELARVGTAAVGAGVAGGEPAYASGAEDDDGASGVSGGGRSSILTGASRGGAAGAPGAHKKARGAASSAGGASAA